MSDFEVLSPRVMVSVGTDHHCFDRLVNWVDEWSASHPGIDVLVQRGTSAEPVNCSSAELIAHDQLLELFARSEVVVSHGGPSTVMDARMVGRKPIVVARDPELGEHVDAHQMRFARHLQRHDLAEVIEDKDQLFASLDRAIENPIEFVVSVETGSIPGVVGFGRALDQLLGASTPLTPSSPAGAKPASQSAPSST